MLDAGEVVEQGSAEDILTAPTHPFTVSLTEKRLVEKRRDQIQPSSHA